MTTSDNFYEGREHSEVKHSFVRSYLEALAVKLAMFGYTTINFVDGFAGPWDVRDEETLSDTSFVSAISTLESVRAFAASKGKSIRTRYLLCERDPTAFRKLNAFAASRDENVHVFEGEFEDNLGKIGAVIDSAKDFTLTFIDPKGWKLDSAKIFDFLRAQQHGEVLLNFMSDHINRHAEFDGVNASFGMFLGNPDWREEYDALQLDASPEKKMLHLFKRKLEREQIAKFCPDMPIREKDKERTKMRLLLGTRSAKGVVAFRDVQRKEQEKEQKGRDARREARSGQTNFFSALEQMPDDPRREFIGSAEEMERAELWVRDTLAVTKVMEFQELAPYVLSEAAVREPDLKKVLKSMRERGQVRYDLPSGKRVPQPDTVVHLD